jgi:hypothetical protein
MAEMVKFPSQSSMLIFVAYMESISYLASSCFMSFLMNTAEPAWALPSGRLVVYVLQVGIFA